jgi:hypothetical protein
MPPFPVVPRAGYWSSETHKLRDWACQEISLSRAFAMLLTSKENMYAQLNVATARRYTESSWNTQLNPAHLEEETPFLGGVFSIDFRRMEVWNFT